MPVMASDTPAELTHHRLLGVDYEYHGRFAVGFGQKSSRMNGG
jgi:hypothetical protein